MSRSIRSQQFRFIYLAASSLVWAAAPGVLAQGNDAGSLYPKPAQRAVPAVGFTPRPVDPPGSQSIDIFAPQLDQDNVDITFGSSPDTTQQTPRQDVLGPVGGDLPGHPGFSQYGFIFNNKTGRDIKAFDLKFSTSVGDTSSPVNVPAINVETDLRTNDLQNFVLDNNENSVSTWNSTTSYFDLASQRNWTVHFTEANGFRWGDVSDPATVYPSFTVLGSLFPLGSNINFVYHPSPVGVPEPGVLSLLFGAGLAASGFLRRRLKV